MTNSKLIHFEPDNKERIIAISDIHGNFDNFRDLLFKVNYIPGEDYLVIIGDICEKGENSLEVVRYLMKLIQFPKVYVLEGNWDPNFETLENDYLLKYIKEHPESIFSQMIREKSYAIDDFSSILELKKYILSNFKKEFDFLSSLPTILVSSKLVFVHAGLEKDWRKTKKESAVLMERFMDKENYSDKIVIVGHYIVSNYLSEQKKLSYSPIYNSSTKVWSIDGGNSIRMGGQLNALMITNPSSIPFFSNESVDGLSQVKIKENFLPQSNPYEKIIQWPHYEIEVIEESKYFSICRKSDSGGLCLVKNEYIKKIGTKSIVCCDHSSKKLNVNKGDVVYVIDDSCSGYAYVKKDSVLGWVPNSILDR